MKQTIVDSDEFQHLDELDVEWVEVWKMCLRKEAWVSE